MGSAYPMGRIYDWRLTQNVLAEARNPIARAAMPPEMRNSGAGKIALLHPIVKRITGGYLHIDQGIGDCASMGGVKSTDYTRCVQIDQSEGGEEFVAMTATEPTYAYGRVEIARNMWAGRDGCSGAAIAKGLKQGGTLLRQVYTTPNGTTYDLRKYSGALARKWGGKNQGVPDELEPTMREHPVRDYSLVTTYEEFRDLLFNGYAGFVSSDQGFSDKRDADGFAKPSGSWSHIMTVIGMDDNPKRPGVLIDNSWPVSWISGPTRYDQPPGSFWVDADVFEKRMLRPDADSYVISGFEGYPVRNIFEMI